MSRRSYYSRGLPLGLRKWRKRQRDTARWIARCRLGGRSRVDTRGVERWLLLVGALLVATALLAAIRA